MDNKYILSASLCLCFALSALPGCSGHSQQSDRTSPSIFSRIAGEPASSPIDTWNPEINRAARRFHINPSWIRAVMMQESGGHQYMKGHVVRSSHGAVGLMQLKPSTYKILAERYHLGSNPYTPENNIMAGTAYMRELYDRFGRPGFLAAYTCGPGCMIAYQKGTPLPYYARLYMDSVSKHLNDSPMEQMADSYITDTNLPPVDKSQPLSTAVAQRDALAESRAIAPALDDVDDTPDGNGNYNYVKPAHTHAPSLDEMRQQALDNTKGQNTIEGVTDVAKSPVAAPTNNNGAITLQMGSYTSLNSARSALRHSLTHSPSLGRIHHQIEKVTFDDGRSLWRVRFTKVPASMRSSICASLRAHAIACSPTHS